MLGRWTGIVFLLPALWACAPAAEPEVKAERVITPSDFVLTRCPAAAVDASCALVTAGGKRVLMGTPDGALSALGEDLETLDAVFLFALEAADIEGLDTVRNRTWTAGRRTRLQVYGPRGTGDVLDALNLAYQTSDALTYVANPPVGGFDVALLEVATGAFDTGDLRIEAADDGYTVRYGGRVLVLVPCGRKTGDDAIVPACAGAWPEVPYFLAP